MANEQLDKFFGEEGNANKPGNWSAIMRYLSEKENNTLELTEEVSEFHLNKIQKYINDNEDANSMTKIARLKLIKQFGEKLVASKQMSKEELSKVTETVTTAVEELKSDATLGEAAKEALNLEVVDYTAFDEAIARSMAQSEKEELDDLSVALAMSLEAMNIQKARPPEPAYEEQLLNTEFNQSEIDSILSETELSSDNLKDMDSQMQMAILESMELDQIAQEILTALNSKTALEGEVKANAFTEYLTKQSELENLQMMSDMMEEGGFAMDEVSQVRDQITELTGQIEALNSQFHFSDID